jgi:ABC-2 type transport system permease protein
MEERMWFNEGLDNAQYMIPGIIAVLVTIISMMLSSINLVREKEIGTLER